MPTTCCIINCNKRSEREGNISFYRLPKVISHQGEETETRSEKRRRLWLAAINRSDVKNCDTFRVCSEHFVAGKPAALYDETNPNWVPSLNMGYDSAKKGERYHRLKIRKENAKMSDAAMSLLSLAHVESPVSAINGACEMPETTHSEQLEMADIEISNLRARVHNLEAENSFMNDSVNCAEDQKQELSALKEENKKHKEENECLRQSVHKMQANMPEDFENDDSKVKYYTSLPSFTTLMALFNILSPRLKESKTSSLCKFQKLIITLMRLRLNLSVTDLAYRFGVSSTTISKVFLETIHIMFEVLQPLVRWPDRDELYSTMPMSFRKFFGCRITIIIDCFEIFIDRPSNMSARAQTWSNYKHHNTAKYLIGITPQGSVSFISEGWGGRVSDKFLTANCKFVDKLNHGDVILADRGFEIQEIVALAGAEVKFPCFTRGKKQLSAVDLESTRKIANVRIHVERVIGSVRQKFCILGSTIPIDFMLKKAEVTCPVLDQIVFVCCALTNLSPSVVPFD